MGFGLQFLKSKPPLIKKSWLRWSFMSLSGKDAVPCSVRILHEADEVNIVHESQAYHRHDLRKSTVAFYAS